MKSAQSRDYRQNNPYCCIIDKDCSDIHKDGFVGMEVLRIIPPTTKISPVMIKIFTTDFTHFISEVRHLRQIYKINHKDVDADGFGKIYKNGCWIDVNVILANKKDAFYKLLHKYMLIHKLSTIPELTNIIASLMNFNDEIITII